MPTAKTVLKISLVCLALLLMLGGAAVLIISGQRSDSHAPRFVPGPPPGAASNLLTATYNGWGEDMPFQLGRIWVWTVSNPTNFHRYWVSLDDQTVVGELLNVGETQFSNADGTKLLCSGAGPVFVTWKERLAAWLAKITGGRGMPKPNRNEAFWILDLRGNYAKRVGGFSQVAGAGSRWHPAPGSRFGYNIPTTSASGQEFYLCDLEEERMMQVRFPADVQGWWDEHQLLMKDPQHNFLLFDVLTRQTNLLFSAAYIRQALEESGLPVDLDHLRATPVWTGIGYTFHFSARTNWINGPAYVLESRAGEGVPQLRLLERALQFEWLGNFNSNDTLYVFPGESGQPGRGGDGSVHIRDVRTGETRTLVESDGSNQYTLPRFYQDRIIYVKARQLWSIDVNGGNNFRLFEVPVDARGRR